MSTLESEVMNPPSAPPSAPRSNLAWSAGAGVVGALLVVVAARFTATANPSIATVDLQKLLTAHITSVTSQHLDKDAAAKDAARYAQALESSLDALAHDNHALILTAPAVVRGAPDLTDALQARLTALYGEQSMEKQSP